MAVLVLLKRQEVQTGKPSFISRFGVDSDNFFQRVFSWCKRMYAYANRKTFVALISFLAYHILFFIRKIYVEIKHRFISNPHGKHLIDAVRGRGEIKDHGASFFLRKISADK